MFSDSVLFDDSFTGSGFSYVDEYNDDCSEADDASDLSDDSLNEFEIDDLYDEAFDADTDFDSTDLDLSGEGESDDSENSDLIGDNGFNDDLL